MAASDDSVVTGGNTKMKKVLSMLGIAVLAIAAFGVNAHASMKDKTWTGWISDSSCGVKGADASHAACGVKCVKDKGASWVFVTSAKKVIKIDNQDAVNSDNDLGHQVKVTGHMNADGTMHVTSVAAAGMAMSKDM
jgi:hypothetical protein